MCRMHCPGILGSGFGLYGYLPALIKFGSEKIILPERYRFKFEARSELNEFRSYIDWVSNESKVLNASDSLVIAVRPDIQEHWLSYALELFNLEFLILEKPLSSNPTKALNLLERLIKSNKQFRISYIFRYLLWADCIINQRNFLDKKDPVKKLEINWFFYAHHFENDLKTWKRDPIFGGGLIRFYGIHIIALMAEAGYENVLSSNTYGDESNEAHAWKVSFSGVNLPLCNVEINAKSENKHFSILQTTDNLIKEIIHQNNPFNKDMTPSLKNEDVRIVSIINLCSSFGSDKIQKNENHIYINTLLLWEKIERVNIFTLSFE